MSGPEAVPGPVVRTGAGAARGRVEDGLTVSRGIPFAALPAGRPVHRPASGPSRPGTREAYALGPPPPRDPGGPTVPRAVPAGGDRPTAGVRTPGPDPAARRPVTVWTRGGAREPGHAGSPGRDARRTAGDGDR